MFDDQAKHIHMRLPSVDFAVEPVKLRVGNEKKKEIRPGGFGDRTCIGSWPIHIVQPVMVELRDAP